MPHTLNQRRSDLSLRIALLGILPIAVLAVLVSLHIYQSRDDTLDHARSNARQLVRTLEAGVSATMQSAEIVADFVIGEVRGRKAAGGSDANLPERFVQVAEAWPFIQAVVFFEPNGRAQHAAVRGLDGQLSPSRRFVDLDLSDRPLFKMHRDATPDNDPLYVSGIVRSFDDQNSAKLILLTKGIWSRDGEFLGVASVSVRQDMMKAVFDTALPIEDGAITLFRNDAQLLMSTGKTRLEVGKTYDKTVLFSGAVKNAPEESYLAAAPEDGIDRVFAYRVAPRYPLVVAMGIPTSVVLAEWRRATVVLLVASILSAIVIALLTMYLVRRYRLTRAAQFALRESETRLKDLIECSTDYQWETDGRGVVTAFGGYGIEKFAMMLGKHSSAFFAESSEPHDLAELLTQIENAQPIRYLKLPVRGREGEVRWVRMSCNPVFDSNGEFRGYRGVGTDITDVRRQRDLIEAQRRSEALGRLASGLAHEINNLLQPILIYASTGASARKSGDETSYFVRIRRAAESASAIVKNVLMYSRQGPPRRQQVELADVVRETVDLLGARIPGDVDVRVDIPADASCVWVDRTGCGQVLTNLVTNSLEALAGMTERPGVISITAVAVDIAQDAYGLRAGRYAHVRVADNGPGIEPVALKSIFDPFYTTKPQGQGTGLGLSVAAGLVKSWGGAIAAVSQPGEYAEFSLYLPLTERQMQAAQ